MKPATRTRKTLGVEPTPPAPEPAPVLRYRYLGTDGDITIGDRLLRRDDQIRGDFANDPRFVLIP